MMTKYSMFTVFVLAILFCVCTCFADTFTNQYTGERFNGYIVQIQKGDKTQIRSEKKRPRYVDLADYEISYNHLGRKNKIIVFSLKQSIDLLVEVEAFEKAIVIASNQGPLFILIEVDMLGGRVDLAQRFAAAIKQLENCRTVAFINGGEFGGAFSAGAIIALACDKVYMRQRTTIGGAETDIKTIYSEDKIEKKYSQAIDPKSRFKWQEFASEIAKQNNRPVQLVKAMVDKNIEIIEVVQDGNAILIDPAKKRPNQTLVHNWSEKGSLLTLLASDAKRFGIADKVFASQDDLFADLGATKAKRIRNKEILKARRQFGSIQRKFERILPFINTGENRTAAISEELYAIEKQIDSVHKIRAFERKGLPQGYYRYSREESKLSKLRETYEYLLRRQLTILRKLIRNYEDAVKMTSKYADLTENTETLQRGLASAQATFEAKYRKVTFRSRYMRSNRRR